ncbi:MAG: DNA polymerase I [Candidatus Cloacimonetes bacterium]|nr:DNA polymerase I [Candidatus Cloacimonadota bacterium]
MKKKLFILDGTALAYRAHFAFIKNPLINTKGQHTSALYGIISSFLKIYDDFKPEYIAIAFDSKDKTFRHDLFSDYKANRPPMPDELISQMSAMHTFFGLAGVKELTISGVEADDLIGSLSKRFENTFDIVIVSGDKDFAQLVNENICLYDPKNNEFLKENDIFTKYEIKPSQFIDYLSLVGDSSDNIPGAKGIGPKTAVKLLNTYENIDLLYEKIDNLSNCKEKEKLLTSKENVFLSKILATIKTDIDLKDINENNIFFEFKNLLNVLDFLDNYELRNLKNSIKKRQTTQGIFDIEEISVTDKNVENNDSISSESKIKNEESAEIKNFTLIQNIDHLNSIICACKSEIIAVDTETTSKNSMIAELVGISFCFSEKEAFYMPLGHSFAENLNTDEVLSVFKNFLIGKIIIGHNLKYDIQVLYSYGFEIEKIISDKTNSNLFTDCNIFDTMLAAYLLDPGKNEYSLDDCAKRELGYVMKPISDLIGKGKKQISFAMVNVHEACEYAAEDAWITYCLYKIYEKRLLALNLYDLFINIEIPLIFTLAYMEKQGVNIDVFELNKLNEEVSNQIEVLIQKIYQSAGEVFNINSPQQLSHILFEKLKIDPLKKIKTGFSTDIEVLESLADKHEIARLMIDYRHLTKMKNTYIESLPTLVNPQTKRIHTSFNQTITSTGRLSSSNPNLQNIPIKTDLGKKIRNTFTTSNDKLIISADYSQIELRLLAILSNDESMINAFKQDIDIHTNTAAKVFKKDKENVDKNERRKAKAINFGIIYGMGANSLSKELSIGLAEAKDFINNYFNHFPTIQSFIENQKRKAHQNGYVETIYHRRLYLNEINTQNQRLVSEAERIAINMPIQGSAADIIKIAMINIYQKIKNRNDLKMLIQVHDELVFEVEKESLAAAISLIRSEMENALLSEYRSIVPLVVDIEYNHSWAGND